MKEGKVLFNATINTFFNLQLYGVGHMVKDHSDSEKGNLQPPLQGLLFPISSKRVLLYAPSHRQDSTPHGLCYTSRGALAGTSLQMIPILSGQCNCTTHFSLSSTSFSCEYNLFLFNGIYFPTAETASTSYSMLHLNGSYNKKN